MTGPKLVIVTGALGWLGKRLVRLLAMDGIEHETVRRMDCTTPIRCLVLPGQAGHELTAIGPHVSVVEGDLRSSADCRRICEGARDALLIHTAGIIHPRRVREFFEVNRDGTANLLDAAESEGVRRAVVVSSNSPFGANPHADHLFDEESPYAPYMGYGRSKMEMECVVKDRQARGDLETVIVRAPWFYGPDQPRRQTQFFSMIKNGKGPIVGSGENRRSMAYVDNLSQGLMLAGLVPRANGRTYWISDRRPYSMNEIIDTVERLLEQEFEIPVQHKRLHLPRVASDAAWLVDRGLQTLGFYHQKIHVLSEMSRTIACSITRAEVELGYAPKIELEDGMRRSIRWCIDRGIAI